jgi:cysteine sulfinate desulfinase/cysteine desulfurase-like protein
MGYDEKLASAPLRVTLGWNTQAEDLEKLLEVLPDAYSAAKLADKNR